MPVYQFNIVVDVEADSADKAYEIIDAHVAECGAVVSLETMGGLEVED